MSAFDNVDYWHISEVPPGWSIGERVGAANALKTVGVQSNAQPHLKAHLRPIVPTTWNYDEDGKPTTLKQAATKWLLIGDLSGVTRADIVQVIADELAVLLTAVDAKIVITKYDHAGALQFLSDNAVAWGDE
jgi:hypothetical protein